MKANPSTKNINWVIDKQKKMAKAKTQKAFKKIEEPNKTIPKIRNSKSSM